MGLIDANKLKKSITQYQGYVIETINGDVSITIDDLLQLISELPTIKQENWIPCSETLPVIPALEMEDGFNRVSVMATIKDSEVPVQLVWFDIEDSEFYDDWDGLASKFYKEDILAWQALPEPYKEANSK